MPTAAQSTGTAVAMIAKLAGIITQNELTN
jgi:hypothetical protein